MSKKWIAFVVFFLALFVLYISGPRPSKQHWSKVLPDVPKSIQQIEEFVSSQERKHSVKPGNHARIVWADSNHQKTPYSVIYLHGFSASQEEGNPVHTDFARKFGCNLFLSRLADHGIDTTEQLLFFTGDRLWESAKEALMIGRTLGDSVIIMSTSTGGTVALMLAAAYPELVHSLINLSPNIAINNPLAFLSNNPWGLQLTYQVVGKYNLAQTDSVRKRYWNDKYRVESVVQLQELLEDHMNQDTFQKIKCPSLTLYYYLDEDHQDKQVKVSAMLAMHEQLATPLSKKRILPVPMAGEHVLGSHLVSKDIETVQHYIDAFATEVLGLKKNNPTVASF